MIVENRYSKYIISVLLAVIAGFIVGCEETKKTESVTKKIKIGVVLFGDSRMPQVEGFKDGLNKFGYKPNETIEYIVRNAKNKRQKLKPLIQELLDQSLDMLVAAGGLEADTIKKMAPTNLPVLVLYVNAIVERGLVTSRLDPGWNVTGVDNLNAELSGKRIELMHDLLPSMKRILILYYQKIPPSRIGVKEAKKIAEKLGLQIEAKAVSSREDIRQVMVSLKRGEFDAMLTVPTAPIDNALQEIILPEINRLGLPLFTHSRPLSEKGALASYGANFYDLGFQASRLAKKILMGTEASKIPFETPKKYFYVLNSDAQTQLNIKISSLGKSQINEFIKTEQ